jgi:hypothetical protein
VRNKRVSCLESIQRTILDTLGAIQRGEVHGRKEDKRSTIKRSYRCSYSDTSRDNHAHMDFSKLALSLEGECWSYRAQQYVSTLIHSFIYFIHSLLLHLLLCYHHNLLSSCCYLIILINYLISTLHNILFMFGFALLTVSTSTTS